MARVALTADEQVALLQNVRRKLAAPQSYLAQLCQVHPRTFSDWVRGKSRMKYEPLQQLIVHAQLTLDREIGQLPEFSHVREAARLGGLRRGRLHGNPGTPEGRRRGGLTSIAKRRALGLADTVPDGFLVAKVIKQPGPSTALAEFMGIMLGDGCLNSAFQAAIYFNRETDGPYALFVTELARQLFNVGPRQWDDPASKGGALIFSSAHLVRYLMHLGFGRGDKVTQQAGVPAWILADAELCRTCLRGLIDTDGSIYRYGHTVYGKRYLHQALCLTNRSHPLLAFAAETLIANGYHPTRTNFRVYLYKKDEVDRYFADIGTHNAKHKTRYQTFTQCKESGEVSEPG